MRVGRLARRRYTLHRGAGKMESALQLMAGSRNSAVFSSELMRCLGPSSGKCDRLPGLTESSSAASAAAHGSSNQHGGSLAAVSPGVSAGVSAGAEAAIPQPRDAQFAQELRAVLGEWRQERAAFSAELKRMRELQEGQAAAMAKLTAGMEALLGRANPSDSPAGTISSHPDRVEEERRDSNRISLSA